MADDANTETSTPAPEPRVADGGQAKAAEEALSAAQSKAQEGTDWKAAYRTQQSNYNKLYESARGKDQEIQRLSGELQELKAQMESLSGEKESVAGEKESLAEEISELQGQQQTTQAELDMYRQIAETPEFRILAGIAGTLQPQESGEATREMLQGMSRQIGGLVEQQVGQRMEGVLPTGNMTRNGSVPSLDQLYSEAMAKAGSPAGEEALNAYYAALEASNTVEIPRPMPGAYDDLME